MHCREGEELERGSGQRVVALSGADALQLVTGGAEHCNALATAPRPGASELRRPPSGAVQQAKIRDPARRYRQCFWDRGGEVEEEGKAAAAAAGGGGEVEEGNRGKG